MGTKTETCGFSVKRLLMMNIVLGPGIGHQIGHWLRVEFGVSPPWTTGFHGELHKKLTFSLPISQIPDKK